MKSSPAHIFACSPATTRREMLPTLTGPKPGRPQARHVPALGTLLTAIGMLVLPLGAGAQQNVYHRDNAGTDLWWHSNNPWYYQTWNNNQDRPDRTWRTANDVFFGHNNHTTMTLNGSDWYYIRTLTFQSTATSARTFSPDSGNAGIDLMGTNPRIQNDSPAHHVFNVRMHLHATLEVNTANGHLTFNGVVSGNAGVGLTKTGGHTLVLANANTYSGDTTIAGGRLLVTGAIGGGAVTVQFFGIPGYDYVVQRSCNTLDNWADLSGPITAPGNGLIEYTDTPGGSCNPAFYRIRSN